MAAKRRFKLKARYIVLAFLLAFCILGGVSLSQQTTLETIADDTAALQRSGQMLQDAAYGRYLLQLASEREGKTGKSNICR